MANNYFVNEGENLTKILIAKVAYLRTQGDQPCLGKYVRFRPRKEDGTYQFASFADFARSDAGIRQNSPTPCARETVERNGQFIDEADGTLKDAVVVDLVISRDCMVRQVNEAILAMRKTTVLGSSDLPCLTGGDLRGRNKGEFDINVRELVRLLYLGGGHGRDTGILAPATVDYMYAALLAARGAPSDDTYSVLTGCDEPAGDELGSPEDTADRHAWYRELGEGIGDFFEWLFKVWIRTTATSLYVSNVLGTGGLAEAPFLILSVPQTEFFPLTDISVPESENHRLMIETSRFLTNADIIDRLQAEDYDRVDDVRKDQEEVRKWLLNRLQDIAMNDFREYNARPYTRYSLNAVLNLYDFGAFYGDATIARAAHIVLDLSEAKFAATSNRGRRVAPFRRRSENDGYVLDDEHRGTADLYNIVLGGDHEVARAMILAGQTQLLSDGPTLAALAEMVNAAVSGYRLPPPVLATAVERNAFSQTVKHTGVESVVQSAAFTISAGGVPTDPTASVLGKADDSDYGVAMPTVILPTIIGWNITDLIRFEGFGAEKSRTANTCVAQGFACGIAPQIPSLFSACASSPTSDTVFVSSALCFPGPGPHFYLAARISACTGTFCPVGQRWGVMEIVEAPSGAAGPGFLSFQVDRLQALDRADVDSQGNGSYVTSAGHRVDFTVAALAFVFPKIRSVDGSPPEWKTAGAAIDADGAGHATLNGLGGPVIIDFSDETNPKRTPP